MGYSVVNVEDVEGAGPGGAVRFVRRELGVEAFGINWFELPPDAEGREHDESSSGQEEVLVVVRGSGHWRIDGVEVPAREGSFIRLDAGTTRCPVARTGWRSWRSAHVRARTSRMGRSEMWDRLSALPLKIDAYELERLSLTQTHGFQRVTTLVRFKGDGHEGLGEDVSPYQNEESTLHEIGPVLPLAGEWTLGELCARLHELDQWPIPPEWDPMRLWRNWAFESAALDLALNQAGKPLHEVLGREPRPIRFVNSLGLGDPPRFAPIADRLAAHPGLRFKLDAVPAWTPELIEQVAATQAVEIIDFKGQYGLEMGELPELLGMYERVIAAFPDALLEDAHDLPEVAALLAPEAHRISYDAPIRSRADIESAPLTPVAVNIKPCRVGRLESLLDVYAATEEKGLITYGGGMGELGVGRGQIQLLASLFHPDGPNDTAPGGYNIDAPAADLPGSPLPASPTPTGFRRTP